MDETNSTAVGMEEELEAMEDDWDDIDFSDLEDDSNLDSDLADLQGEEAQGEPAEEEDEADGQDETDQLFTLKHLDETREVGRDEVIALAQKGMDYDRIRQDRDTARAELAKLNEMQAFLQELAEPSGMTIEELMDTTRANVLAEKEGLDRSVALQRVKLDRDRKALEAERQSLNHQTEVGQQQAAEQQRMRESMDRFIKDHPDLKAEDIPNEVWEAFARGKDLGDAYALHESKLLKEQLEERDRELEILRQNKNNKARSTGSQTTAGSKRETESDAFDRLWYDGT